MRRTPNGAPRHLLVAVLAATVAACSSAGSPGASPTVSPGTPAPTSSPAPDQLILRVFSDGGFVPPGFIVTRVPQLSIYADGRAIEPGAVPAIYPGPPVTPLAMHQLSAAELEAVRSAARTAGLDGPDRTYSDAPVADAPTTVFTYVDAAGEHRLAIYALGIGGMESASAEERAARAAASELLLTLGNIVSATSGTLWEPEAYRVYASGVDDPAPSMDPAPNVLDWPTELPALSSLPVLDQGPIQGRCGVLEGADAVTFRELLDQATQITRYREAGAEWTLLIRPLLPDEVRSCA